MKITGIFILLFLSNVLLSQAQNRWKIQPDRSIRWDYVHIPLSEWKKGEIAFAPVLVECANNKKVCISEKYPTYSRIKLDITELI